MLRARSEGAILAEHPMGQTSSLGSLPLVKWASRMHRGSIALRGTLPEPFELEFLGVSLSFPAGPLSAELSYEGGPTPWVRRLQIGFGAAVHARSDAAVFSGARLEADADGVRLDEAQVAPLDAAVGLGPLLRGLVDRLAHVWVSARAEPDGELLLQLGHGVQVHIPEGVVLTVQGASQGPATELLLCEPLVVGFGGDGLRLSHDQFRMLSRLASVRLVSATLHPDGRVALEGHATRGVDVALRAPLHRASARLSELVRRSPHFKRVRAFLKHDLERSG
jgi:hypothetical protein